MRRLDSGDLERIGRFVAETAAIGGDEPFPPACLEALQRLIPCDSVAFCELDRVSERVLGYVALPARSDGEADAGLAYWDVRHEHPVCRYHEASGDWRAYRITDFVGTRRFRSSRIYADWFRPQHVERLITVGLDSPLSHTRVFLLERNGGGDFDPADCLVLDVLRPYLAMRYDAARVRAEAVPASCVALTRRERQVLDAVAEGKTNHQVAEALLISDGTVRRHLENAYAKLGVHTRTAAVRALNGA